MNCELIETPRGDGSSDYSCQNCNRVDRLPSGFAKANRQCGKEPPPPGPGTHFMRLTGELGILPAEGCDCAALASQMDLWGVEGCNTNREEILCRLSENYRHYDWRDKLTAAAKAVSSGLALRINPAKPLESLLEIAIERAITA